MSGYKLKQIEWGDGIEIRDGPETGRIGIG
jgi:hypothetical protein